MTKQIVLLLTLFVGGLIGAKPAAAQHKGHFFLMADRGSFFLSSPYIWSVSSPGRGKLSGFAPASAQGLDRIQMVGLDISGLYLVDGLLLGYEIGAASGESQKTGGDATSTGGKTDRYTSSSYQGEVLFNIGVLAYRSGGFCLYPLAGVGASGFAQHNILTYGSDGSSQSTAPNKEAFVWNPGLLTDGALAASYTLAPRVANPLVKRLTIGLRAGYKQQWANSLFFDGGTRLPSSPSIGAAGFYAKLILGIGLIRTR